MPEIILYHGSSHIIVKPEHGFGSPYRDFGPGFYCTENLALAREWAVDDNRNGYVNKYVLDTDGLKILDLSDARYFVLHWIALLATHRMEHEACSNIDGREKDMDDAGNAADDTDPGIEWLKANFSLSLEGYDIVKGYCADDICFLFAEDFMSSALPVQGLARALKLGDWDEQTVLISEKAFSRIRYTGSDVVSYVGAYDKRCCRNTEAFKRYRQEILNKPQIGDIRLAQLVAGEYSKDDPRLWIK